MVDSAQGGRILEAPVSSSLREVGGVRKTPKRLRRYWEEELTF